MGSSAPPRIAIIGAGPGGATLARILHLHSIPFELFEGEASSSLRAQGSTLDLHETTGLAAVRACDLWTEFAKHARYDGEANTFADKNYRILVQMGLDATAETSVGRPEVDRSALRQLLVDSLPPETIQWGRRVREVRADGTLRFDHGDEGPFDLIVGADGAWSKVRPHLMDAKPVYSGIGGIGLTIDDPAHAHPDLYEQVHRGSLFVFGDAKGLQPQQLGSGQIHAYTWSRRPENWMQACGFDPATDVEAARKQLADLFHDWHPQLRKFTQVANPHMQPRNLYMLPVGVRWEHRKRFTLVGDAAHLMTPFAGEGVNLAMADAMDLANAIVAAAKERTPDALDRQVAGFEELMFARAKPAQEETQSNQDQAFDTTPGHLDRWVIEMMADAPPEMVEDVKAQIEAQKYGP